mmetsp:Transcript_19082/g.25141  ORF Transcript_19082/g.25141 Transcript_19082/m.25141 type:complete len:478 (+) Transcript_19082:86-1519(+)
MNFPGACLRVALFSFSIQICCGLHGFNQAFKTQRHGSVYRIGIPSLVTKMALESSLEVAVQMIPVVASTEAIEGANEVVSEVLGNANEAVSAALEAVSNKFEGANEAVSEAAEAVSDSFEAAKQGGLQQILDLPSIFQSKLEALKGDITATIESTKNEALGKIESTKSEAIGKVDGAINNAKSQAASQFEGPLTQLDDVSKVQKELEQQLTRVIAILEKELPAQKVFGIDNAAAIPFWGAMVLFPNNDITKAVMKSYLPVVAFGLLYVWSAYLAFQEPLALEGFSSGILDLATLTKGFSSETAVATAWAHFIAQDLFIGRFIYLDGMKNRVFMAHSLLLTFLFGPAGVISHLFTRGLFGIFRSDVKDIIEAGAAPAPAPATAAARVVDSSALKEAETLKAEALTEAKKILEDANKSAESIKESSDKAIAESEKQMVKAKEEAAAEAKKIIEDAKKEALAMKKSAKSEPSAQKAEDAK